MVTIRDEKYKLVKNFLTKEEVQLCSLYAEIKHRNNCDAFDFMQNNNGDTYYYGDSLMTTLLLQKRSLMEKQTNLKLHPTYAFWRVYTYNAELEKHKDRDACEISVTVMINSDGTKWPIFMDGKPCDTEPGDAVIYLGKELEHWREPFTGDFHMQCFLHYVEQNGPCDHAKYDNKPHPAHNGKGLLDQ